MRYQYAGYNAHMGVVKGRVDAHTEAEARTQVLQLGYKVLRISRARRALRMADLFPSLFSVNTGELVRFCRQLAIMLASGGSLLHTLEVLQSETRNSMLRQTLESIRKTLDDGGSLSAALAEHPKVFTPLFVRVVEVGEYTGRLGPALEQMATMLEKEREAKQRAMRTMMYPAVIMTLSILTLAVMMTVALPPLLKVFQQMGSQIPLMTRVAVALMAWIKSSFLMLMLAMALLGTAVWGIRHIPAVKLWMDDTQVRLPLFGALVISGELSRFSRTIAMLLDSGVPLATAIRLGLGGCKNTAVRRAFAEAEESLLSGHGLTDTLKRHSILPRMFVQLVSIGEESNSLQHTMAEAANAYQQQLDNRLNSLLTLLEPLSTVMVGAIVGFIAFSMFVPIYSGMKALG